MKSSYEAVDEQQWVWLRGDFKEHVATVRRYADGVETMTWTKPGSSISAMYFCLFNGMLSVTGDLGEAVIENRGDGVEGWGSLNDFSYYFMQKIRATSEGKPANRKSLCTFEQSGAIQAFKDNVMLFMNDEPTEAKSAMKSHIEDDLFEAFPDCRDGDDFTQTVFRENSNFCRIGGSPADDLQEALLEGVVVIQTGPVSIRIKAIWLALQMAYKQLHEVSLLGTEGK